MTKKKVKITAEDIINIWLCLTSQIIQLNNTDKKSSEDIKETLNRFIKIEITL